MENLIQQYLKSVYNYVFRLVKNEQEAEDIVQEVFVKVWKNLKKIDPNKNLKNWILTIARNTTFDHLRKNKDVPLFSEEDITDLEPLPDEIFMKKELALEIEKALFQIRPDFAEIIFLHYNQNMTFEEISEVTGKPLNTVKSWHLRGLKELRKLLA